jgi:uncharacterized protein YdaU (DUF1376 family)
MSLAYFPLYPADYEADTSHLTLEEDGAYSRLLRLCWLTPGCSIPDEPEWIMRRMRVDADTYARVVAVVLGEFFKRRRGRLYSPLIEKWIEKHRKGTPRKWISLEIQNAVKQRDGTKCRYCGCDQGPFHLDHVQPYSRGGKDTLNNLVVACARCNWDKGAKTLNEWMGAR